MMATAKTSAASRNQPTIRYQHPRRERNCTLPPTPEDYF
jgi:hypothetical protein